MGALEKIESEQIREGAINFRSGDTVRVHVKITEGDKQRIQIYEGVVIAIKRGGTRGSFTVRKISYGVGVERIFPIHSPMVDKVEVVSSGKVRRAKLYYLRNLSGKAARLKDSESQQVASGKAQDASSEPASEEPTPA